MSTETAVARVPMPIAVKGVSQELYDKMASFREDLEANLPAIMAVLPQGVSAAGLASTALAACIDNPRLLDCTALSLFRAVYKSAALNLRIGETCDIVGPLKGKAECWVRVKGVVEMAQRSRAIQWARVGAVCEGEVFEYEERGDGTHFRHVPSETPKADASNVTHIYAVIVLPTGVRVHEVWTIAKALEHKRRFAKDIKPGSAWAEHPLAMMSKSVVKAALRFAPLAPELQRAIGSGDEDESGAQSQSNPAQSLELAAGALDALETMDAERVDPETGEVFTPTLAEAEQYQVKGKALKDIATPKLVAIHAWARDNNNESLEEACEIVLQARPLAA